MWNCHPLLNHLFFHSFILFKMLDIQKKFMQKNVCNVMRVYGTYLCLCVCIYLCVSIEPKREKKSEISFYEVITIWKQTCHLFCVPSLDSKLETSIDVVTSYRLVRIFIHNKFSKINGWKIFEEITVKLRHSQVDRRADKVRIIPWVMEKLLQKKPKNKERCEEKEERFTFYVKPSTQLTFISLRDRIIVMTLTFFFT